MRDDWKILVLWIFWQISKFFSKRSLELQNLFQGIKKVHRSTQPSFLTHKTYYGWLKCRFSNLTRHHKLAVESANGNTFNNIKYWLNIEFAGYHLIVLSHFLGNCCSFVFADRSGGDRSCDAYVCRLAFDSAEFQTESEIPNSFKSRDH